MISALLLLASLQCQTFLNHPPGVDQVPNTTLGCDEISPIPQVVWLSMLAAPTERGGNMVFTVANTPYHPNAPFLSFGLALTIASPIVPGIQFPGTTGQFCTWHIFPEMVFFGVMMPAQPCYHMYPLVLPPIPGLRGHFLRAQLFGEDRPTARFVTNSILLQVQA